MSHLVNYSIHHKIGAKMPKRIIKMIYYELDHLIQNGKRQQPKNLFQLLQRSTSFIGLNNFDHIHVPSMHTKESSSCWTLPVMTLATIAVALPQEDNHSVDYIINSVTEGLKYADLVDKSLEPKLELRNIRKAVQVMWPEVQFHQYWLHVKPITRMSREGKSSKEILQDFASIAENILEKFIEGRGEGRQMDLINWPNKVMAANSMYRISKTLLLAYDEEGNAQTTAGDDDGLLEKLVTMIADILSACLTNLPYLMTQECYDNSTEKGGDRLRPRGSGIWRMRGNS